MDFRNSFKSHGSYKQIRSPVDQREASPEHRPILHDHDHHPEDRLGLGMDPAKTESPRASLDDDGRNAPVERDASYKFWQDNTAGTTSDFKDPIVSKRKSGGSFDFAQCGSGKPPMIEESPTRMTSESMRQRQWGGGRNSKNEEITLDVDQENEDVSHHTQPTPTSTARTSLDVSRELRVSFNVRRAGPNFTGSVPTSSSHSSSSSSSAATMRTNQDPQQQEDEVVRCTSNMSLQRKSELISRVKTRSRLQDPPREEDTPYSGWNRVS